LVNGIESELTPQTNNTVELVIRRFDQHYQPVLADRPGKFCSFDTLEATQDRVPNS